MIKTILVPATGSDRDVVGFDWALGLAAHFAAHLDFLHVRIDPAEIDRDDGPSGRGDRLRPSFNSNGRLGFGGRF